MDKTQPTLSELSDCNVFRYIFNETIKEFFNKKGLHYSELPHGVTDPSWPTGKHITDLSFELSQKVESAIGKSLEEKFKKYNPQVTKLSPEVVNEIWMIISNWVGEKIEQQAHTESGDIPGLKHGVEEGVILVAGGKKTVPETTVEDRRKAREKFLEKLPHINDEILLLQKFRNNLYQFYKEKYGIFNKELSELNSEIRISRK